jgi:hypothetical protein
MFIDSKLAEPEELESPAPYYTKSTDTKFNLALKKNSFNKFVVLTAGQFVWPSEIVEEEKLVFEKWQRDTRPAAAIFVVLLTIGILIAYFLLEHGGATLALLLFFPVLFCILSVIYYYVRSLIDGWYLFNDTWTTRILESDSVQLEEVMVVILRKLQTEFPYPLRFYLAGQYPRVKYTGRTKTMYTLVRLKEAVLYPQDTPQKEESTGAI